MVAATAVKPFKFKHPARRLGCGFYVQPVHWSDNPAHDEGWANRVAALYGGRESAGWLREYEMQPITAGVRVWPMLTREVHVLRKAWEEIVGPAWTRYRVIDQGMRHPTCCGWVAVNAAGDQYWYRQYYAADRTIAENVLAILDRTRPEEAIEANIADPAIWARNPETGNTWAGVYQDAGLALRRADNSRAGYDAVSTGLVSALARWSLFHRKPHGKMAALEPGTLQVLASKPAIWFAPECAEGVQSLYEECASLRYEEPRGDPLRHAAPEKPVDVNDEGADVVRYGRQTAGMTYQAPRRVVPEDIYDRLLKAEEQERKRGRRR
ncbi:MAG TPA: hypothetical protein VMY35_07485 [Phycisphaerae bacterium]|nr:hypothetical protein [Phycisphaerae bacterium]